MKINIKGYKEVVCEEVQYDPSKVVIPEIKELQSSINQGLEELEGMLG